MLPNNILHSILQRILELSLIAPAVLIALIVHECSHGFIAYLLGDKTAKEQGRLSLNPIRHIDIVGAVCMLFFGFGWAKPVPIDVRYFKNPKRDMALTALAGPLSNIIMGFLGCLVYTLSLKISSLATIESHVLLYWICYVWLIFAYNFAWLNISLAIFNLIPLPPLDGSRIFFAFLPPKAYFRIMRYEREISIIFFAVLFIDKRLLDGFIIGGLSYVVNFIFNGIMTLFSLIF